MHPSLASCELKKNSHPILLKFRKYFSVCKCYYENSCPRDGIMRNQFEDSSETIHTLPSLSKILRGALNWTLPVSWTEKNWKKCPCLVAEFLSANQLKVSSNTECLLCFLWFSLWYISYIYDIYLTYILIYFI